MKTLALASAIMFAFIYRAVAFDNGQYQNVFPEIRQWFKQQTSPKFHLPCCSIADGHRTIWRGSRDGYEVPIDGVWYPVPPDTVIIGSGNPMGEAVVWYFRSEKVLVIRCFVPGGGA